MEQTTSYADRRWTGGWRAALVSLAERCATLVRAYWQARRERAQLLALNDRELRDIGLSRVDALREAERPFWRR